MSLKRSYSLLAPVYDWMVAGPLREARRTSLARLPRQCRMRILLNGVGTGLDLPYLPSLHDYIGVDLTAAMLARAALRRGELELALIQGDSLRLPFANASFDCAVLHLIVAVTGDPVRTLQETARVLKPGARVLLLDKFLRAGRSAPLRRALSPLMARIATRLDVVFEDVMAEVREFEVISDEPALAGGWFRRIELLKTR